MNSEFKYAISVVILAAGGILVANGISALLPTFTPEMSIGVGVVLMVVAVKTGLVSGKKV